MQNPGFTFVAVLLSMFSISFGLEFSGTYSCYAQYEMWDATTNGTLQFEFKTSEKEGLLAYMDDGGQYDFLELKVTEGHVRLRFRIGDSAQTILVGDDVNDGEWHQVEVIRNYKKTELRVDSERKTGSSNDREERTLSSKSDLYFGGIPRSIRLTALALPSVMFDTRFKGDIRNVFYGLGAGRWRNPTLRYTEGTKETPADACAQNNPCLNNGLCISGDSGASCDCTGTGYEGEFCKLVSAASVASFDGQSYFTYDLSKKPISSQEDAIQFEFRTRNPDGLILQSGHEYDYVYFGLEEGDLAFSMNLGSGAFVGQVSNNGKTFSDNEWHKVVMTRKKQQITIEIDEMLHDEPITLNGRTTGAYASFTSDEIFYVGGAADPSKLYGSKTATSSFVGCLKEVKYTSNSLALELSTLARKGDAFISLTGNVEFSCKEMDLLDQTDPVTFMTPAAYLAVDKWDAKMTGSLSYRFRTNEPNGVLMYNNGEKAMSDHFAMELLDGYLNMILDLGSGTIKLKCHKNRLNDGEWHFVRVEKFKKEGSVRVDDETMPFRVSGDSEQLDLQGSLFIGGIDDSSTSKMLPREMWSGMLGYGFVGCMRDLNMNGKGVDLAEVARTTAARDIGLYCESQQPQCVMNPCRNGGICSEGWNRFVCDCRGTRYTGETCYEDAATVSFDGTQYMRFIMNSESRTEAEDIALRFKTQRAYGLLMATTYKAGQDTLMLELDSGKVKLSLNLGAGVTELFAGESLNDMEWHTIRVTRKLRYVSLAVDDEPPVEVDIAGDNTILEFSEIEVGALTEDSREALFNAPSNFLGHMENFILNNNEFFEMAKSGTFTNILVTASFDNTDDQIISDPVTFKSREDFVMLSPPDTYPVLNIFFQFRTVDRDGLILFNDGDGNDFLAVELVDGYIHYVFNTGDKTNVMRANTVTRMNNNEWHEVTITRDNRDRQVLKVDDATTKTQPASGPRHIDLTENMRVGGVEANLYESLPEMVQSKSGYLGCIASLDMNGKVPDLINDALNIDDVRKSMSRGCEAPNKACAPDSCLNRGECSQMWNDYSCDCDMTTYTGDRCEIRGSRATFGRDGGIITFTYPEGERPGTHTDKLALGFMTKSTDVVLARIDSIESKDYIEIEIDKSGALFAVYNMGTDDHPVGNPTLKVNDGKYHVVRFHRNGANATLQVDDHRPIKKTATGDQLKIFNSQTFVKLGARGGSSDRRKRELERGFSGSLQGVHFNGIKVIDLALTNDERVQVDGDITLSDATMATEAPSVPRPTTPPMIPKKPTTRVTSLPTSTMQPATTATTIITQSKQITTEPVRVTEPMEATPTDDDIYYESGSGCNGDDEDNCEGSGTGTDEKTPKPMKPPKTTPMMVKTTPSVTTMADMQTTTVKTTTMMSTAKPTTQPIPAVTTPMMPEPAPEGSGNCEGMDDEDCDDITSGDGEAETTPAPAVRTTVRKETPPRKTDPAMPEPHGETTMAPHKTEPPVPQPESTMKPDMGAMTTKSAVVTPKVIKPGQNTEPMHPKPEMTTMMPEEGTADGVGKSMASTGGMGKTAMVVGIVAAVCIAVLVLLYAIYKYRNRNEGSYRIDESRNYSYGTPSNTVIMPNANGTLYNGNKDNGVNKPLMKKQDSREWYV